MLKFADSENMKKQFLKIGSTTKEIMINTDSKLWWLEGMIVSYHLSIQEILHLRHDRETALYSIVSREFGKLEKGSILIK